MMKILQGHAVFALCILFSIQIIAQSAAVELQKRETTCSSILVIEGDSCDSLAARCGITTAELTTNNPTASFCSSLTVGKPVCCSSEGTLTLPPSPKEKGLCYSYTVQYGDSCSQLASGYGLTVDEIESYNSRTWAWYGCNKLQLGGFMCLSSGEPPMPVALPNAVCGPQVPGTTRPDDWSQLGSLNPCAGDGCCATGGQCVNNKEDCAASMSVVNTTGISQTTRATSLVTYTSAVGGCVTNCGLDTTKTLETTSSSTTSTSTVPSIATLTQTIRITVDTGTKSTLTTTAKTSSTSTTTLHTTSKASTSSSTKTTSSSTTTHSATTEHSTTTTSATKTTEKPAPTESLGTWMLTMYTSPDCKGNYYLLQGHNKYNSDGTCLDLHGNITNQDSYDGDSCRWYYDEGLYSAPCNVSRLRKPISWYVHSGMCSVYYNNECKPGDQYGQAVWAEDIPRCRNWEENSLWPPEWNSLRCSVDL